MRLRLAAIAAAALLLASAATAQRRSTVEINPFAGYLFGGEFARGSNELFEFDVDVDDDVAYGGRLGFNLNDFFQLEFEYVAVRTAFTTSEELFAPSGDELAELDIDYFLGYGTFHFGGRHVVGYFTMGAGAAHLDPGPRQDIVCIQACTDPSADTRFTTALGGGVKIFVTPNFGFRFDGRGYATFLDDDNDDDFDDYCHGYDDCDYGNENWLWNSVVSGGIIIAF
jgi:hypothetical protein